MIKGAKNMKNAVIIYNLTQTEEKFAAQIDEFVKEFAKVHIKLFKVDNASAERFLSKNKKIKFVLFYDKDARLAAALESKGYLLYNSAETIRICDDKGLTQVALEKHKINTPKTRVLPEVLGQNISFYMDSIEPIISEFTYPFILKERIGSFGDQVYLIKNKDALVAKLVEVGHKGLLIQEFIECSSGKDYRAFVINKKVIVVKRTNENDFRSNVNQGGEMSRYTSLGYAKIRKVALKSAKAVKAKFAGVDIVFNEYRVPLVLEVNSNARTLSIRQATDVNVTRMIAKYIKRDSKRKI